MPSAIVPFELRSTSRRFYFRRFRAEMAKLHYKVEKENFLDLLPRACRTLSTPLDVSAPNSPIESSLRETSRSRKFEQYGEFRRP